MKTKKIVSTLASSAIFLVAQAANATDVTVTIRNLSSEMMRGSSSDFPTRLAPGETATVKLNFFHDTSYVNVSYSTGSKTCHFAGSHRVWSDTRVEFEKSATSNDGRNNCYALQSVYRWSSPYDYVLTFQMTD